MIKEVKKFDIRRIYSYRLEEDSRHILGSEALIDEKNFIILLLSTIAEKSKSTSIKGKHTIKKGALPINYRDAINSIMNTEGAIEKYGDIIDVHKYYINNTLWVQDMVKGIDNILDSNKYDSEFCYTDGTIIVNFTYNNLKEIHNKVDQDILDKFKSFTSEFIDYYKEEEKKYEKTIK